ncbi:hypothetical protein BDZ94DRAFT_1378544 [Collybia nuda]|uniref:Uncharacterized protein n=1 Tax=Collybia nuda TaxID=64659 RepID=A0A9P6CGM3_9AGAR|nr:hypothetical protein BDZ94DRAFT_1378544 [Collybia nuda]
MYFRVGRSALACHGEFWYPVRLIHRGEKGLKWHVRWWRGCDFKETGILPDEITAVGEKDIIDSLWMDRTGRRKIRLGKWKHACDVETPEDILMAPGSIPYTPEIDVALSPSLPVLKALLNTPEKVVDNIPAKSWIITSKKKLHSTIVPYVGSLTVLERARIANWFETHVSQKKELRQKWLGLLPIAHAHTIFISSRIKSDPRFEGLSDGNLLQKAWDIQITGVSSIWTDVDVDKESLARLEEEMFEVSVEAGIAGHYQWGLDSGSHQDFWDPYSGLPEHWNHGNREGSDAELEVSINHLIICK